VQPDGLFGHSVVSSSSGTHPVLIYHWCEGTVELMTNSPAADRWARDLASWAIPQEILDQAPEMPWVHPVKQFTPPDQIPDSLSHQRARAAVPEGGSVLDVGSGGGRASLALVPPATHIVGVDTEQAMLDVLAAGAASRGVSLETFQGAWPTVADSVPECDVVVCHHVVFNVPTIAPFLTALSSHARRRVVIECPVLHPLSHLNPLWKRFWNLDRPTGPSADDLLECAREVGIDANLEVWSDESWGRRAPMSHDERVAMARTRVCLTPDRDAEVAQALDELGDDPERRVATLWWDIT